MAAGATKKRAPEKPPVLAGQYRTDGTRLFYIVEVGAKRCEIENCAKPLPSKREDVGENPTMKTSTLENMEVVTGAE